MPQSSSKPLRLMALPATVGAISWHFITFSSKGHHCNQGRLDNRHNTCRRPSQHSHHSTTFGAPLKQTSLGPSSHRAIPRCLPLIAAPSPGPATSAATSPCGCPTPRPIPSVSVCSNPPQRPGTFSHSLTLCPPLLRLSSTQGPPWRQTPTPPRETPPTPTRGCDGCSLRTNSLA